MQFIHLRPKTCSQGASLPFIWNEEFLYLLWVSQSGMAGESFMLLNSKKGFKSLCLGVCLVFVIKIIGESGCILHLSLGIPCCWMLYGSDALGQECLHSSSCWGWSSPSLWSTGWAHRDVFPASASLVLRAPAWIQALSCNPT